jgi:hypothetical protein
MEVNSQNFKKYLEIVTEIDNCLYNIKKDTSIFSFPKYLEHQDYKTLINMGGRIIPYLFHYATQEHGFSWIIMSLLSELSGENPVSKEHEGKFAHQISDWMNWFINSKYIESDVYHDLID